jgi:hypothetical protein
MFFSRRRVEAQDEFEAEARHMLLGRMVAAYSGDDSQEADRALLQATRWLTNHPDDDAILEARGQLRTKFKPLRHSETLA